MDNEENKRLRPANLHRLPDLPPCFEYHGFEFSWRNEGGREVMEVELPPWAKKSLTRQRRP